MRVRNTDPLFAWDCLDDHLSLRLIKAFLQAIPDARLLEGLRHARGRGRNDYPVHVLWAVVLLTAALRHPNFESCLGELRRNPSLRRLIGIDNEMEVPKKWNISRFLEVLGQQPHLGHLRQVFDLTIQRLGQVVPDLGRHTAGDATGLNARRNHQDPPTPAPPATGSPALFPTARLRKPARPPTNPDGLCQPTGGRKEYTDEAGTVVKIVQWFGYKLHLVVDVTHEVSLAYQISSAQAGDNERVPELVQQAQANLPEHRIQTLAYDKAADDGKVHRVLAAAGIKPLIQNRCLWKDQQEQVLAGAGLGNLVYDEAGTVYCYDMVSDPPVRHRMAFDGHEAARGTLKYRCPARHEGWPCPSEQRCNADKTYGLTVRVKQDIDLRRFPPIPRATKQFERLYKGRTAVERVNARLKLFWGADDGNIAGPTRFHGFVGAVMVVHAGLATVLASAPRREGTLGKMRLPPIAQGLLAKIAQ